MKNVLMMAALVGLLSGCSTFGYSDRGTPYGAGSSINVERGTAGVSTGADSGAGTGVGVSTKITGSDTAHTTTKGF